MVKKKKTQLKPIARGFATTSIPKKIVQVDGNLPPADEVPSNDSVTVTAGVSADHQAEGLLPGSDSRLATEQDEYQDFQIMIDKYQEKTDKEISRTIKAIEVDKRISKGFYAVEVDPTMVEDILRLHLQESSEPRTRYYNDHGTKEKATTRLAVTYGTLRKLGFSEGQVGQCLRAISSMELSEALDWLVIHCPDADAELSVPYGLSTLANTRTSFTQGYTAKLEFSDSSNTSPIFPSHSSRGGDQTPQLEKGPAGINLRSPSSKHVSPELDDPNLEYAQIQLQLTNVKRSSASREQKSDVANVLEERLRVVKSHYFFDERDAEQLYYSELGKVNAQLLQATLRGSPDPTRPDTPEAAGASTSTTVATYPDPGLQNDFFDQDDAESSGGLLEILDAPSEVEGPRGTTISVKEMSFHKQSGGKLPKVALLEYVSRVDRYAAVTFSRLSGHSRAKRSRVQVLWGDHRMDEWKMEDIACYEESQAEQYIATVALHSLSFPSMEGFATTSTPIGHTFFRLFPPVFRDLWDKLEADRKVKETGINREIWAKLWSIVGHKIDSNCVMSEVVLESVPEVKGTSQWPALSRVMEADGRQIIADLKSRQSRPAYQEMLNHRNSLPIAKYRENIISTLENTQIFVLCGETGCGKSTQVPAFILEDQLSRGQPCKIYCTEPRRISAISLAQRVSRELGDPPGMVGTLSSLVGYAIRLESNTTKNTRLIYMTTGIALRMLEHGSERGDQGTGFDDVTHIIIDEVHERTIESDFLLVVLKSLLPQRPDLRVILMSATVDSDKISSFFGGCPVIHIPGRTFPVRVLYLEDAIERTGWSISEDSPYARRGNSKFYQRKSRTDWDEPSIVLEEDEDAMFVDQGELNMKTPVLAEKRYALSTQRTLELLDERVIPYDLIVRLLEYLCFTDKSLRSFSSAVLIFMPGLAEIRRLSELLSDHPSFRQESLFRVFPLHSTFSSEDQSAVFDDLPTGMRKIVIATNIAETGITIPDITCVIDSGKQREIMFDEKRQLSRLVDTFVTKSNAAQRRGRAGRVQKGICFHLFTKLRHDSQLAERPLPEIMRLSLSDLALRIKTMNIKIGSSIEDVLSRALDPPASINVQRAVSALVEVRALTSTEDITPMGRLLSKLPTDVHLGKLLLIAVVFRCLDPALTVAAALSSKSPFVTPFSMEEEASRAKSSFCTNNSDFLTIHTAFAAWRRSASQGNTYEFCRKNFLSHENLLQIEDLRRQFLGYLVDSSFISVDVELTRELNRARFGRNRHRFVMVPSELDSNSNDMAIVNATLLSGLYPKLLCVDAANGLQMRTLLNNQTAFFHPSSVNFRRKPKDIAVNYLVYFTLMQSKKLFAWETAPVDDLAILLLCGECDFKLMSDTAIVDRKIKYRLTPRTNIAIKILRTQLNSILARQFRGKALTGSQTRWHELATIALGRTKLETETEQAPSGTAMIVR